MSLLTSYKDCILNRFRKDKKEAKDRKQALKDRLAKDITIIDGSVYNMAAYDKCIDDIIYDLAGYVVHSRQNLIGSCVHSCRMLGFIGYNRKPTGKYVPKLISRSEG